MGLSAELSVKLDVSSLGGSLLGNLTGPLQQLNGVSLSVSVAEMNGVASPLGDLDLGAISTAVSLVADRAGSVLGSLPVAGDLLGSLSGVVATAEQIASGNLPDRLQALLDRMAAELDDAEGDTLFAVLARVTGILTEGPEGGVVRDIFNAFTSAVDFRLPSNLAVPDWLLAVEGAVRVLGGLMTIETLLAEAEQISLRLPGMLDAPALRARFAALEHLAGSGSVAFLDGVAADDLEGARAAVRLAFSLAGQLDSLREQTAASLGLGEATVLYLDMARLKLELDAAGAIVRTTDLDPLRRLMASVASGLGPLAQFDPGAAPSRTVDEWLTVVEGHIQQLAAAVRSLDLTRFTDPLADGIGTVTGAIDRVADVIQSVTVAFRAAMEQVRAAVAALPLEQIAETVRTFLGPVTAAVQAISDLLDAIEAELAQAATVTSGALTQIDEIVSAFSTEVNDLFASARQAVEAANLDQVIGAIEDNIRGFADVLAKAQMKPYFDTASGAIGGAADVIGAVPFSLLPEDMKAEVDAAVKPIRDVNTVSVKAEIENILQIEPGGTFALRDDLVQAIATLHQQYLVLLASIRQRDPRIALAAVDAKFEEIAARIREIEPGLTLEPVRRAIDEAKRVIGGIDFDAVLEPVRDAFDRIDAAIDSYAPATLIEPFEGRLDEVRQKLIDAIAIDRWAAALDDLRQRAADLAARVDPAQLEAQLALGLAELDAALVTLGAASPFRGLGTVIASLLQSAGLKLLPSSFETVLGWVQGADGSAHCAAHAARIADALAGTRASVSGLDITALAATAAGEVAEFRQAAQSLANRLAADSRERAQLTALLPRLDASAAFGGLVANQARYLALLERASALAENLRTGGFSEVSQGARGLATAIAPLDPLLRLARLLVRGLGFDDSEGLAGIVRTLLASASPQRLAAMMSPLFVALRDRLEALIDAILDPLKDGIADVKRLIGEISLTPLKDAMAAVTDELKAQIASLHPDHLLQPTLAAFEALKTNLIESDPLGQVIAILDNLKALIAGVLEKLTLETILASPLAIYDTILADLESLDPRGLLDPVFAQLDEIAAQVDAGLTDTLTAFERLQAALPSGGGGSSVSVSVSVGA